MNLRRITASLASAALLFSLCAPALASTGSQTIQVNYMGIQVTLDGQAVPLKDANGNGVEPFALDGTTYLPVRAVSGALGLGVNWDADTQTVLLTTGGTRTTGVPAPGSTRTASVQADYSDIKVTLDGKPVTLTDANGAAVEPFAIAGTTYLPVRAVANALDLDVDWDADAHTVVLTSKAAPDGSGDDDMLTDSAVYVQGLLDKMYKGQYNKDYLALIGQTEAEAEADYLDWLYQEVDYFCDYFDVEYPTEAFLNEVADFYQQVYAQSKYTVGEAARLPSGNYAVEVKVAPIDIMLQITDAEAAKVDDDAYASAFGSLTETQILALPDEDYAERYLAYDLAHGEGMLDLLKSRLNHISYGAEKSIVFQLVQDVDGLYELAEGDLQNFDNCILSY